MRRIFRRIQPIFTIILSVLVILICAAGTVGMWVVESTTSSVVVQALQTVDDLAQVLRNGVSRVDNEVASLGELVTDVQDASAQLSQAVNDKGLLLTLLPPAKEAELTAAVQSVRDDFAAVRDFLKATQTMLQTINRLPFIDLPGQDMASSGAFQERIDNLASQVEVLKGGIEAFRSQVAADISRITDATASLNLLLDGLRTDLAQVDSSLSSIQDITLRLQKLIPAILITGAIIITIMAIWIAYSQGVMINKALEQRRSLASLNAEVSEDQIQQDVEFIQQGNEEVVNLPHSEADENPPGSTESDNPPQ